MTSVSEDFTDLLIAGIVEGTVKEEHLSSDDLLELELALMDTVAIKRAGGDHLVHWETCGEYQ